MAKGNVFNFVALQVWKYLNGVAYGQLADPTNPGSTPVTTHAYAMFDGISAALPTISRAIATFRGGGVFLGSAFMGVENIAPFDVELANYDDTLNVMVGNGNTDTTTVSGWSVSGLNERKATPTQLGMMLALEFQSRASGTDGDNMFLNVLFPNVRCTYNRVTAITQNAGENPSPSRLSVAPSSAGKFPSGVAFGSNQGWQGNSTAMVFIVTPKPLAITTFIADGTATTFTLGYRPYSSTVTSGNTTNSTVKNGTATAVTSIATANGLVTLPAAGNANDVWVVTYPTEFLATS